ncbi:MAG: hypothetical protein R2710_14110 [Acidimicrobiales bacterium]
MRRNRAGSCPTLLVWPVSSPSRCTVRHHRPDDRNWGRQPASWTRVVSPLGRHPTQWRDGIDGREPRGDRSGHCRPRPGTYFIPETELESYRVPDEIAGEMRSSPGLDADVVGFSQLPNRCPLQARQKSRRSRQRQKIGGPVVLGNMMLHTATRW